MGKCVHQWIVEPDADGSVVMTCAKCNTRERISRFWDTLLGDLILAEIEAKRRTQDERQEKGDVGSYRDGCSIPSFED